MALLLLQTISGVSAVYASTITSAFNSGLFSAGPFAPTPKFWTTTFLGPAVTRLVYDRAEDAVVVGNGLATNPNYVYPNWMLTTYGSSVSQSGVNLSPWAHIVVDAATLDPAKGGLSAQGLAAQLIPSSGGSYGFTQDPNTQTIYQVFWHFITAGHGGGGTFVPFGYGDVKMLSVVHSSFAAGFWFTATWDGQVAGEQVVHSNMLTTVARPGRIQFAPGFYAPPLPPIVFDDIVVFVYADTIGTAWISCRKRPATTQANWRGTRSMPFGWPFAIMAIGVDRCMVLWWSYPQNGAPLIYTVFRYDRTLDTLRLEDVGDAPTGYSYNYPNHVGYAAWDHRRGHLIFLSPNPNDFTQFTADQFCHPGIARSAVAAQPLSPTHAGATQRFAALTYTGATLLATPVIIVSYPGFASTDLTRTTFQLATEGPTGTGTFAVSWASAASGASGSIVMGLSSYSVGISATYSQGVAYGVEGMALLTSTATFTVSTTLSAATATSLVANVVITPRVPVSQADMVGAGSPRLLSYPTSALASPLTYALNPQVWTNFLASPLTRPLYASQRTLSKTATVAFQADVTDLEVTERWLGGGNRIAMALSQFAALYDYFNNPPDLVSVGFITWEPRDISSKKYKVLLTNLTVGGGDAIEFDHMVKAGVGWITAEVALTMRLIAEV